MVSNDPTSTPLQVEGTKTSDAAEPIPFAAPASPEQPVSSPIESLLPVARPVDAPDEEVSVPLALAREPQEVLSATDSGDAPEAPVIPLDDIPPLLPAEPVAVCSFCGMLRSG